MSDPAESGTPPNEPVDPADAEGASPPLATGRGRRRARITEPTQQELDALPVEQRLELLSRRRAGRHQTLNSIGILFGVVFTLAGLVATWLTLHNAEQGQITDRYNKATEQLSSSDPAVRLSAIYALRRLLDDSARDRRGIIRTLAGYVRLHAQDRATGPNTNKSDLAVDVRAALGVIPVRRPHFTTCWRGGCNYEADLSNISFRGKSLVELDLGGTNLGGADLRSVDLSFASLVHARLEGAKLEGAKLSDTRLTGATLRGATWSRTTQWPASVGGATGMRTRSAERKKGIYVVTLP
ncbi:pentapeptide repeat-containing protein [Actinomadura syzygii]|uniref:pentapeptide repeat-containing protein n=1 Tax=Actinomadura syzygii TaxID=1427538 RepID=UPI00165224BB|nr:pentapeptide repeat-containing protein [Actinomadura syzygii]